MKIARKARPNLKSDTFNLSLQLNKVDVKAVLQRQAQDVGLTMPKDFWIELLGKWIGQVGVATYPKPLSIWSSIGEWGFSLALRHDLLLNDNVEDGLYFVNPKKFKAQPQDED